MRDGLFIAEGPEPIKLLARRPRAPRPAPRPLAQPAQRYRLPSPQTSAETRTIPILLHTQWANPWGIGAVSLLLKPSALEQLRPSIAAYPYQ